MQEIEKFLISMGCTIIVTTESQVVYLSNGFEGIVTLMPDGTLREVLDYEVLGIHKDFLALRTAWNDGVE